MISVVNYSVENVAGLGRLSLFSVNFNSNEVSIQNKTKLTNFCEKKLMRRYVNISEILIRRKYNILHYQYLFLLTREALPNLMFS